MQRVTDFGWHVQLQLNGCELPDRMAAVNALACPLVIDHVGKFLEPVGVTDPAFKCLMELVDRGAWVKLSAAYETSTIGPPNFDDVGDLAKALIKAAPEHMLWASNWPHPAQNPRPDDAVLLDTLLDWTGDSSIYNRILADNPENLYSF